jgi:hypothetical protein
MSKRPFYTHPQPGDEHWSNSFDLLFRGLELVTGGQRLHRHPDYLAAIRARGEDPAAYADYLEAFAHGMPPHGGFAIGLERWTGRLTQARQHQGGHAVPAGPAPPDAVGRAVPPGRWRLESTRRRLGTWWAPRSSKPVSAALRRWRVRFPSASATCRNVSPGRAG